MRFNDQGQANMIIGERYQVRFYLDKNDWETGRYRLLREAAGVEGYTETYLAFKAAEIARKETGIGYAVVLVSVYTIERVQIMREADGDLD